MGNTNNNGWLPMKIVEMLVERMEVDVKHSLERVSNEISESLSDKLDLIGRKIDKMILTVRVVFSMLAIAVLLAGFGSHFLYKRNSEVLTKEIVKRIEIESNIDKTDVEDIIDNYMNKLKEGDDETSD